MQNDLFDVGADLDAAQGPMVRTTAGQGRWIDELEADCDTFNDQLRSCARSFFPAAPWAAPPAPATTVVRRRRRFDLAGHRTHGTEPGDAKGEGGVNAVCAAYLNRLSGSVVHPARVANLDAGGDVL